MPGTVQLYPLSSQDGKAIPTEIVKPKSLMYRALVPGVVDSFTIPADFIICWIFSAVDCVLKIGGTAIPTILVEGTTYPEATFIPKNAPILLQLEAAETCTLMAVSESGTCYLSAIEQWGSLLQGIQFNQG